MKMRVAINGFGRIGRQIAKLIMTERTDEFELVAVNTLEDVETAIHLLKYDSSYGHFLGDLKVNGDTLSADSRNKTKFFHQKNPENIPWGDCKVDLVFECSGNFSFKSGVEAHLNAKVKKVIITAASSSADTTICYGVNNHDYKADKHHIISSSSCTTNCLAPIASIIDREFGITSAMATFLHSYTGSQPVLDKLAKDPRRSRSGTLNIIPTTTSAENQIPVVLPNLAGRFQASAIRVPTPVVHLADFTVKTNKLINKEDFIKTLRNYTDNSFKGIVSLSEKPLVSRDFRGSYFSSIVDIGSLKIYNDLLKVLIWHDNEFSYSNRVLDLAAFINKNGFN